tara:strand:+ start:399 stop:671 length:273 start_codon:yes stop_codon:yes gene_type:complete
MKKSRSSTDFFGIGPFAKHRDEIINFGSGMYLSYAILDVLQKQKSLEKLYLNALALDDEENMILYKQELDLLKSTFDTTLIATFAAMPEV